MQKLQNSTLSICQKIKQQTNLFLNLWNNRLKFQINWLKSWEFMQNAEFADLTQTTKNELLGFLEFLKWFKVSEMKERELHSFFILVHSITELRPVYQDNLELGFHYVQKFYKSHTKVTLLNKETHKIFYSHKNLDYHPARIILTDLKLYQANIQRHKNYKT